MLAVYFNGRWIASEEANISALDRDFLVGYGVYEVKPAFNRRLFGAGAHLDRLREALNRSTFKTH